MAENKKVKVINKVEKINEINIDEMLKPNESIFAPKSELHKLICGKHNYPHIKNITENGEIYIRRFTIVEENIFKELQNSFSFQKFLEILNKTLITTVRSNIDIYNLSMIEQLDLFIHIYYLTYGQKHNIELSCNDCGYAEQVNVDLLKDLKRNYMTKKDVMPVEIILKTYDSPLKLFLNYPTLEEQAVYLDDTVAWDIKIKLMIHKIEGVLANGHEIQPDDYLDIIKNLNMEDKDSIKNEVTRLSNFGLKLSEIENLFMCKNKSCKSYNKNQKVTVPLEELFKKIFENLI